MDSRTGANTLDSPITPEEYAAFKEFLEQACGILLGDNKQYLVHSRLNRLRRDLGIGSLSELLVRARSDAKSGLRERVIDAMTTNETYWFRDNYPFEAIKKLIFPELAQRGVRTARIWSAACSSGQEPYTISIAAQEYLRESPGRAPLSVQITATDISPSMLAQAKAGVYDDAALSRGLSLERRSRFFTQVDGRWQVCEEIRRRVTFREFNLMQPYSALGKFELIYCRNVLIYFSAQLKRDILTRLAQALEPGGYLVLGASESVAGYSDAFTAVRYEGGMIYRLKERD